MQISPTTNLLNAELAGDVIVSEGTSEFTGVYASHPGILPNGNNSGHMAGRWPDGGNFLF